MRLPSGRAAKVRATVVDVRKNALSVGEGVRRGFTFMFGPTASYLTSEEPLQPRDSEEFRREGYLFYLPVRELASPRNDGVTLAQVEELRGKGEDDESNTDSEMTEADAHLEPFDQDLKEYSDAVERHVENARRHTGVRRGDPCSSGAVFHRTTIDVISDEVITDHNPDRVGEGLKWRTEIPGGPRDVLVRYYYHDDTGMDEPLVEQLDRPRAAQGRAVGGRAPHAHAVHGMVPALHGGTVPWRVAP